MKKKGFNIKIAVLIVLLLIPLYIKAIKEGSSNILVTIGEPLVIMLGMILLAGLASVALAFVFHYSAKLMKWINNDETDDETKEQFWDIEHFANALLPVMLGLLYYYYMAGSFKLF